jgi:hypothetical protein
MKLRLLIAVVGLGIAAAYADNGNSVLTPEMTITPVALPSLPLGLVSLPGGKALNLTVSPGAGAFRGAGDPPGRIWTITDRGPSIDCSEEKEALGAHDKQICVTGKRGKIHLLPGYVPSIYAIDVGHNTAKFVDMLPLKTASGKPVTGLAMPLSNARTENSYAVDGRQLEADTATVEPGGLVRLADGSFWIADSAGPSLIEVGPDGTVRRRLVPANLADDLGGADYPVEPVLPAILSRRQIGHGFDGIALSPDERFLYVAMQNALANPDIEAYRASSLVRLFKLDRATGRIVARYLYQTDAIAEVPAEGGSLGRALRQSDVRVMELAMVADNRLLVLERTRAVARVYLVDLTQAVELADHIDSDALRPSLEQMSPQMLAGQGIAPLAKRQLFRTDGQPLLGPRLSGLAVLNPRELVLLSNNDFGIEGARTQMFRLTFPVPILN